jgi:3-hydroxyisobutyrate dehydrogenase-like beta-hydroxyacid dehydrogenase
VSGNPSVVVAGNLGIIVSGPEAEFERLAPTLRDIGPKLFHVGTDEQARIVKLALNLMLGGTTQLLAEALVLGEHNGIEAKSLLEVIGGSAIGSPFIAYKTDALVADDYSSTFTANLLYKDLALALEVGHDSGVPLTLTAATQQLVQGCIASGMGDMDISALVPRLRRESGS